MSLNEILGPTAGPLTLAQECARALLVLAYGLVAVRLAGRRVFAQWSALDIIVSIVVGSTLSRALTGNAPLWGSLAAISVLLAVHWLLARGAARSTSLSQLLEGRAVRLGEKGAIDPRLVARYTLSEADINEALRGAGIEHPSDTRSVVLEPSGKISVLKQDQM
jgi:uncharacterized membrane protein YcaP (DUF421 family)